MQIKKVRKPSKAQNPKYPVGGAFLKKTAFSEAWLSRWFSQVVGTCLLKCCHNISWNFDFRRLAGLTWINSWKMGQFDIIRVCVWWTVTESAGESNSASVCSLYKVLGSYFFELARWSSWSAVFPHRILDSPRRQQSVHVLRQWTYVRGFW